MKWSKVNPTEDVPPRIVSAVPNFGYKNDIGIDRRHGLIRAWTATDTACHDGALLPAQDKPIVANITRANGAKSKLCAAIEHVFGRQ